MTSTAASAFANGRGGTDWERMWANGIDEGDAFDCRRTEPGFQVMLDRGRWRSGTGARARAGVRERVRVGVVGARAGFSSVVGLEISATARDACAARLKTENIPSGSEVEVVVRDFFEYDVLEEERFDAAYDCTFLCAIDPNKRKEWADVYARVIKPGGVLVSLVFPCGDFEGGPPYALSPEIVKNLLAPTGKFEQVSPRCVRRALRARTTGVFIRMAPTLRLRRRSLVIETVVTRWRRGARGESLADVAFEGSDGDEARRTRLMPASSLRDATTTEHVRKRKTRRSSLYSSSARSAPRLRLWCTTV